MTLARDLLSLLADGRPLVEAAALLEQSLGSWFPDGEVRLETGIEPGVEPGVERRGSGGEVRVPAVAGGRTLGAVVVSVPAGGTGGSGRSGATAALEEHAALWALCLETVRRRRDLFEHAARREAAIAAVLHDEALQHVVAVDLGLQRLRDHLPSAALVDLRALCGLALADLRRVAGSLDPLASFGPLVSSGPRGPAGDTGAVVEAVAAKRLDAAGVPAVVRTAPPVPARALNEPEARILAQVCAGIAEVLLDAAVTAVVLEVRHDHLGCSLRVEASPRDGRPLVVPEPVRWMVGAAGGVVRTFDGPDLDGRHTTRYDAVDGGGSGRSGSGGAGGGLVVGIEVGIPFVG
jgi:hypothetical protein